MAANEGSDGAVTIILSGELDLSQADELWRLLMGTILRSPCVTLDLAHLTFLDCAILGVLVRSRRMAGEAGGWLRISTCQARVRRLLEITGLGDAFGLPQEPQGRRREDQD